MSVGAIPALPLRALGAWRASPGEHAAFDDETMAAVARRVREPVHILYDPSRRCIGLATGGELVTRGHESGNLSLLGTVPAAFPEWLGDRSFSEAHGVRFPYVAGEMANGIATTRMVVAMAQRGDARLLRRRRPRLRPASRPRSTS